MPPPAPAGPPPPAQPCEEAYADLKRYFAADDRRHPPNLKEDAFVGTCRELPVEAQRCMLFSFMQAHANECDKTLSHAPPELIARLASMAGR